jgi:hypothetical protein
MVKKSHYLVEKLQSMQNKRVKAHSSSDTLLTEEEIPEDVHVSFEAAHPVEDVLEAAETMEDVTEGATEEETAPETAGDISETETEEETAPEAMEDVTEGATETAGDIPETETETAGDIPEMETETMEDVTEGATGEETVPEAMEDVSEETAPEAMVAGTEEEVVPETGSVDEAEVPVSNAQAVRDIFAAVQTVLDALPAAEDTSTLALAEIKNSNVVFDKRALVERLPHFPLSELDKDLHNFHKYYMNVQSDDADMDVIEVEVEKRVELYQALLKTVAGNPDFLQLVRLLFLFSAKTFIVACYAVSQGCAVKPCSRTSIFRTRPAVGADVTEVFDDYLNDYFQEGCTMLGLSDDFLATISDECVSIYELQVLASNIHVDGNHGLSRPE